MHIIEKGTYMRTAYRGERPGSVYVRTGEFREPMKGEYYLSGAIPTAYKAPSDLPSKYYILREVTKEQRRNTGAIVV